VMGLLVVGGLGIVLLGSFAGFCVAVTLIAVLWTRTPAARILTMAAAAYAALVGLLLVLFPGHKYSLQGAVSAFIGVALLWLLLRPGMSEYFGSRRESFGGRAALRAVPSTDQRSVRPQPYVAASSSPTEAGNTQEQWARLQQQLRADQLKEEREAGATESAAGESGTSYPWLTTIIAVLIYAQAAAVGGDLGTASLLLVIPGFIAAMVRWIHPQGFLLGVLLLSGFLMVRPEWKIVSPHIDGLLQHHGPMVFAAGALLLYLIAMCASGFNDDCEI